MGHLPGTGLVLSTFVFNSDIECCEVDTILMPILQVTKKEAWRGLVAFLKS